MFVIIIGILSIKTAYIKNNKQPIKLIILNIVTSFIEKETITNNVATYPKISIIFLILLILLV